MKIVIDDTELRNQPVGGYFRMGDTRALLGALEGNFNLEAHWVDDNTVHLAPADH